MGTTHIYLISSVCAVCVFLYMCACIYFCVLNCLPGGNCQVDDSTVTPISPLCHLLTRAAEQDGIWFCACLCVRAHSEVYLVVISWMLWPDSDDNSSLSAVCRKSPISIFAPLVPAETLCTPPPSHSPSTHINTLWILLYVHQASYSTSLVLWCLLLLVLHI